MSAETLSKKSKKNCPSVNCSVCEDAIRAIKDNTALDKKQVSSDTGILDIKTMVKLVKSDPQEGGQIIGQAW